MKNKKGIVMGIQGKQVIAYTDDGDFVRMKMPGQVPKIGDVIEVETRDIKPWAVYLAMAAALILVAVIGLFNPISGPGAAAAYVTLDMAPGVELYVNRSGKIIKTRALDKEAKDLLTDVNVTGHDFYGAVQSIIKEANKQGYINEDKNMLMANIIPLNKGHEVVNGKELQKVINSELEDLKVNGTIVISTNTKKFRDEAKKAGLSVNEYLVYDWAQKEGINISIDSLHEKEVLEILDENNVPVEMIFPMESIVVRNAIHHVDNEGLVHKEGDMEKRQTSRHNSISSRSGTDQIWDNHVITPPSGYAGNQQQLNIIQNENYQKMPSAHEIINNKSNTGIYYKDNTAGMLNNGYAGSDNWQPAIPELTEQESKLGNDFKTNGDQVNDIEPIKGGQIGSEDMQLSTPEMTEHASTPVTNYETHEAESSMGEHIDSGDITTTSEMTDLKSNPGAGSVVNEANKAGTQAGNVIKDMNGYSTIVEDHR